MLSFCETVTAGPLAPWHIRTRPDGEPLKPGGGLFTAALCDRDLGGGWDIPAPEVTLDTLAALAPAPGDTRVAACKRCALEAARLLGA